MLELKFTVDVPCPCAACLVDLKTSTVLNSTAYCEVARLREYPRSYKKWVLLEECGILSQKKERLFDRSYMYNK